MWNEPYLESCCRSALHRVKLTGDSARPPGLKDGPCLVRMEKLGLVCARADGRYAITPEGDAMHRSVVLDESA